MQILFLVIIVCLIIYVIYLHIQMVKKNIFFESALKSITGIDKEWKMDELPKFLEEIKKLSYYHSFFNDKLFEDKILNYILENVKDSKVYIHYTKEEADAKSIVENGFKFADSFYKTALPISDDKLDLIIKHDSRKFFGDYLIVICISNNILNRYSSELYNTGIKDYFIENILTESPPVRNENSDLVFLLPEQYLKGYVNHRTGEIVVNPDFNPDYDSSSFERNIELLLNKKQLT
jgi:hypothetical protein